MSTGTRTLLAMLISTIVLSGCRDSGKSNAGKNDPVGDSSEVVTGRPDSQLLESPPQPSDTARFEKMILDSVMALEEVKKRADYVRNETAGTRKLQYSIAERPSPESPYYLIKVMEDNGESYYTHFNFYVYPKPFEVKFYDPVTDSVLTIPEWTQKVQNEEN